MTASFREKLQPFYHSIFCHLNYTQYLVLSDLAMQSLFNDDFQLLFRIYWELLMWVASSDCIQAPVTSPHSERRGDAGRRTAREGGREGEGEGDQQVCAEPSSADNIL